MTASRRIFMIAKNESEGEPIAVVSEGFFTSKERASARILALIDNYHADIHSAYECDKQYYEEYLETRAGSSYEKALAEFKALLEAGLRTPEQEPIHPRVRYGEYLSKEDWLKSNAGKRFDACPDYCVIPVDNNEPTK